MKVIIWMVVSALCLIAGYCGGSLGHKTKSLELLGYQVSEIEMDGQRNYAVTFAGKRKGPHVILPASAMEGRLPLVFGIEGDVNIEIVVDVSKEKVVSLSLSKTVNGKVLSYLDRNVDGVFETLIQVDEGKREKVIFDAFVKWQIRHK